MANINQIKVFIQQEISDLLDEHWLATNFLLGESPCREPIGILGESELREIKTPKSNHGLELYNNNQLMHLKRVVDKAVKDRGLDGEA